MEHLEVKNPNVYLGVISRALREFPDDFKFDYSEPIEDAYKRAAEVINSKIEYDYTDTADENSKHEHSLTLVCYDYDGIRVEFEGNFVSKNPEENYYFYKNPEVYGTERITSSEINKLSGYYYVGLFTIFGTCGQKILVIEDINCGNENIVYLSEYKFGKFVYRVECNKSDHNQLNDFYVKLLNEFSYSMEEKSERFRIVLDKAGDKYDFSNREFGAQDLFKTK